MAVCELFMAEMADYALPSVSSMRDAGSFSSGLRKCRVPFPRDVVFAKRILKVTSVRERFRCSGVCRFEYSEKSICRESGISAHSAVSGYHNIKTRKE
jgi:hypothetical protein